MSVCLLFFIQMKERICAAGCDLLGSETVCFLWNRLVHQRPKCFVLNYFLTLHRFIVFPAMISLSVSLILIGLYQAYF